MPWIVHYIFDLAILARIIEMMDFILFESVSLTEVEIEYIGE